MASVLPSVAVAARPRGFVGVRGPQAADYLQRMVSNDVEALGVGESCDALLLTAKARLIAPLRVSRRSEDDFLLLTEPELGEIVRAHLVQFRFAARAEIEVEEHSSCLVLRGGAEPDGELVVPSPDYGVPAWEVIDGPEPDGERLPTTSSSGFGSRRARRGSGSSSTTACCPPRPGSSSARSASRRAAIPGQEPIARLHYRGHANRGLRRLLIEGDTPPERDAELVLDGKVVGRVTSAVPADGAVLALGYVRAEVPADAELTVGDAVARPLH